MEIYRLSPWLYNSSYTDFKHLKKWSSQWIQKQLFKHFLPSQPKSKKIIDREQAPKHLQAFKKKVIFQWVPSRVGIEGNEIADKLAKKGTTLHAKESPLLANSLKKKKLLNCKVATKYKHEADELAATKTWRDIHKIWAEYKGKPRTEAVANFRLKTGHNCLAAHLRKNGIYESSGCTICQMRNSTTDSNICYLILNLIPTNKCSRTPPNCTEMPERW
jgi:hypothetical protein